MSLLVVDECQETIPVEGGDKPLGAEPVVGVKTAAALPDRISIFAKQIVALSGVRRASTASHPRR
jgi:hypothetical protein